MNWQLFFSTFSVIFIAELGDKTQLAVLARTAGESSPWTIFLAAAAALVLATAIGVLAGSMLNQFISPRILKIAGGVLFLAFGVYMLYDAAFKNEAPQAEESRH